MSIQEIVQATDKLGVIIPTYPSNHEMLMVVTEELNRRQGWKPVLVPFAHDFHNKDVEYRYGQKWTPKQRAAWESGDHQRGWMFGARPKVSRVR